MVSSALKMDLPELLEALARIKQESGKSQEYRNWRKQFPKDWPL